MNTRLALIALAAIAPSVSGAKGRPQQQIVLSESVMKAMIAQKPKSKTPLTARIPAMRRSPSANHATPSADVSPGDSHRDQKKFS